MARGNFAGVRYELDELFKLSTMGRKPKAKKGSFASENAGFGKKTTWFENDGRAERPGLNGLAVFGSHLHLSTSHQVAVAHWRF